MKNKHFPCKCLYGIFIIGCCTTSAFAQQQVSEEGRSLQIEEIIVLGKSRSDDLSLISKDAESLLATPGDVNDPLKALLSMPGITFGGGDLDEPIIRGASPQNNLFLIDGVPVENIFHELSDSIISPNVIRTFDLFSAAYGAQYGGATGGVIDISLRDPAAQGSRGNIDLGQLKSGFLAETALSDSVAIYGAYRHNLAHFFLEEFERGNDVLVFQMPESRDYVGRLIWRGDTTDITFTALGSWDKTEDEVKQGIENPSLLGEQERRQFDSQSLRIRAELGMKTKLTATLSYSRKNQDRRKKIGDFTERNNETTALRSQLTHQMGRYNLMIGSNLTFIEHDLIFRGNIIICESFELLCGSATSQDTETMGDSFQTIELFAVNLFKLTDDIELELGIHTAKDHFLGETFIEPRLGMVIGQSEHSVIYVRTGLYHTSPKPQELLILNRFAEQQEAERSWQILFGNKWLFSDAWRLQSEIWYKDFTREEFIGSPLARDLKGKAYGLDLLLAKPLSERFYGWVALGLSEGNFTDDISGVNADNQYAPSISATAAVTYSFDNGWKLGLKYRMQSGDLFTPLESISLDLDTGIQNSVYGKPFSGKLSDYHRLDIRLEKATSYDFADATYYIDILNVFEQDNRSNRSYPTRNIRVGDDGELNIIPDEDEGIPLFIALGINLAF